MSQIKQYEYFVLYINHNIAHIQNIKQAIILGNCRYGYYHIFLLMVLSYKKIEA